jgi:outer membrane protein OmpA-like peptidoglycan-associated protein
MQAPAGTFDHGTAQFSAKARFARYCAVASVALLVLSGCSGGDKKKDGGATSKPGGASTANEQAIASEPMAMDEGPAHVDLIAISRTAKNTVTVRFRVVNDGKDSIDLAGALSDTAPQQGQNNRGASGVAMIDGTAEKVYYPLTTSDGTCLCSDTTGHLEAGKSQDVYAVLPAPSRDRVTLWVPRALPFVDAQIGSAKAGPAPDQTLDPASASLGQPTIRPLVNSSETADENVDEDGNNRTVTLSADVLFAYNKANLSPKAKSVLQTVAKQIDASKGDVVKIDGYTDNSGTDAVNQPLSERRAQSVQTALQGMVTRQGVTYQSAGHGSQNPIAKNDDEAGRRRNRRVTIAFAKPTEPSTQAPPALGEAPSPWRPGQRLPVLVTVTPRVGANQAEVEQEAKNVRFDVNQLHRDSSGLVILTWTATGVGGSEQNIESRLDKHASLEYRDGVNTSGVSLLDQAGKTIYWPSRDGQGACMCSSLRLDFHGTQSVSQSNSATFVDIYKPPTSVSSVVARFSWDTLTFSAGNVAIK